MTASPTNFKVNPLCCFIEMAISCANELIITAIFSSGNLNVISVEPTRSTYITTIGNFSETCLLKNKSDSSTVASYSIPFVNEFKILFCDSEIIVSESNVRFSFLCKSMLIMAV